GIFEHDQNAEPLWIAQGAEDGSGALTRFGIDRRRTADMLVLGAGRGLVIIRRGRKLPKRQRHPLKTFRYLTSRLTVVGDSRCVNSALEPRQVPERWASTCIPV